MRRDNGRKLRILVVEDDREAFRRIEAFLTGMGPGLRCSRVASLAALLRAVERATWDVVLSSHCLPTLAAEDVLAAVRSCRPELPVVVVSEGIGGEQAVDFLKAGAADLVLPSNLARLIPAIDQAIQGAEERRPRLAEEAALPGVEARLRMALDATRAGTWEWNVQTGQHVWSDEIWPLFGLEPHCCEPSHEAWLATVHPGDRAAVERALLAATRHGAEFNAEWRLHPVEGRWRWLRLQSRPVHDVGGRILGFLGVVVDFTEMREAKRALHRHNQFLEAEVAARTAQLTEVKAELDRQNRELQEAQRLAQVGSWEWRLDSDTLLWSEEVYRITGRDPARPAPRDQEQAALYRPEGWEELCDGARVLLQGGEPYSLELEVLHPGGDSRWVIARGEAERNGTGKAVKLRGTVQDITERKQAEQALQALATEIEDLYQNAPCGYHSLDREGYYVRVNDTELHWLGYTREEMIGRRVTDFITPESRRSFEATFPVLKAGGVIHDVEQQWVRKDGTLLQGLLSATAVRDARGYFVRSRATLVDLTERKHLEEERRRQEARSAELSRHLLNVQEEERRRLALELHDVVSPNLAALKINLGIMEQRLPSAMLADLGARFRESWNLIRVTISNLRNICGNLRPPALDYAGLDSAVESYAQQFFNQTGIPVTMTGTESAERLPVEVESVLFRIVQEALTNCAKHASATRVNLELTHDAEHAFLMIEDDGVGFDLDDLRQSGKATGLGLLTMGERAEYAGGKFTLESHPGQGTRITVEI